MKIVIVRKANRGDYDKKELMRLAEQWLNPLWDKEAKALLLNQILFEADKHIFSNHFIYVADSGEHLCGFVDFFYWQDWLTRKSRLLIQHVYVDETTRQAGVGTTLLNKIIEDFNPDICYIDTKPEVYPHAEKLYLKVGFKENPKRKWMEWTK